MKTIIASSIAVLVLVCAPVEAQWAKVPPAKVPQTPDGKPDLSAPPPRWPNGKPDLTGIWRPENTYDGKPANFAANLQVDNIPYQPWAQALLEERKTGIHENETQLRDNGRSFRRVPISLSYCTKLSASFGVRSFSMDGKSRKMLLQAGWDIRRASGMATRSLWTRRVSMENSGWINRASQ